MKNPKLDVDFSWNLVSQSSGDWMRDWNDQAASLGVIYAARSAGAGEFAGRIQLRRVANAHVFEAFGDETVLESSASAPISSDRVHIRLQTAGEVLLGYGKRSARLKAGDIVYEEAAPPNLMRMSRDWRQSFVAVDRAVADRLFDGSRPQEGAVIRAGSPLAGLAAPYLASLTRTVADLPAPVVKSAIQHLCALVAAAQAGSRSGDRDRLQGAVRAARLSRAKAHIDRHVADSALSPAEVALSLGCSLRNLYVMFEESGASVAEYIRQRRLVRCLEELSDPDNAEQSVAQIAFACGFADLSTFHRAFRKNFGITPREVRFVCPEHLDRLRAAVADAAGPD